METTIKASGRYVVWTLECETPAEARELARSVARQIVETGVVVLYNPSAIGQPCEIVTEQ